MPKNKKLALNSEIRTNQKTNDDEVCIPRLSCILLAVIPIFVLINVFSLVLSQTTIKQNVKANFKYCTFIIARGLSIFNPIFEAKNI